MLTTNVSDLLKNLTIAVGSSFPCFLGLALSTHSMFWGEVFRHNNEKLSI